MIISLILPFAVTLLAYWFVFSNFVKSFPGKLFITIYTVSSIYYSIFGVWYWTTFQDGAFLKVDWNDELTEFPWLFLLVAILVYALSGFLDKYIVFKKINHSCEEPKKAADFSLLMITLGFFACAYVYIVGGALVEAGDYTLSGDSFVLILYQFSDIPIAVFLYKFSVGRLSREWKLGILIYLVYAIYVGFRYKLILLLFPLLILWFFTSETSMFKKSVYLFLGFVLIVCLFSVLTISRTKIGGVDFDALDGAGIDDYLYGLFAETNILFGLASSKFMFGREVDYVGMQPFYDVFVQFIPRFIYPDKDLYQHLWTVTWGLGASAEAYYSGTAMPYFGEYYACGGYAAVIAGIVFYAGLTFALFRCLANAAQDNRGVVVGGALIAIYMGYYYFSRGSISQISKGIVFIIFPYLYLVGLRGLEKVKGASE